MRSVRTATAHGPAGIGGTPMVPVQLVVDRQRVELHLKVEAGNPTGSIKDRAARSIVAGLVEDGKLGPDSVIVDSTSGTFGASLGYAGQNCGQRVHIVVDPRLSPDLRQNLEIMHVDTECVDEPDEHGSYLAARLARVAELCAQSDQYVWANQYGNPRGPKAHVRTTGPEIAAQMGGDLDAVFVAVSTCGTLTGIARYFRACAPHVRIVAVDAVGSAALGGKPGPRLLTGIGSQRQPDFDVRGLIDGRVHVTDADAFATCWALQEATGLSLGGSSGAVIYAAASDPASRSGRVACVCPDTGDNYRSTLYSPSWLTGHGLGAFEGTPPPINGFVALGPAVEV